MQVFNKWDLIRFLVVGAILIYMGSGCVETPDECMLLKTHADQTKCEMGRGLS